MLSFIISQLLPPGSSKVLRADRPRIRSSKKSRMAGTTAFFKMKA